MKTSIKQQTLNEVETLSSNSNIIIYDDFPFEYLSDYHYHLTYKGRIANQYLLENGFVFITYSEYRDKTGKKLFWKDESQINGNKKFFIKNDYYKDLKNK